MQAPLTLWDRDAFERRENQSNIAQGLYYGAMVVIAIYNFLIFIVVKDRSYRNLTRFCTHPFVKPLVSHTLKGSDTQLMSAPDRKSVV